MNRKGFTLIELLAVIIILGILMLIAIPSVSNYVNSSRKNTYVTTINELVKGVIAKSSNGELKMLKNDTTYYVPTTCIKLENGEASSPNGKFDPAYVAVTFDHGKYNYYFTGRDVNNSGVAKPTRIDLISNNSIENNISTIDTSIGIDGRAKIVVFNEDCSEVAENKISTMMISGEGEVLNNELYIPDNTCKKQKCPRLTTTIYWALQDTDSDGTNDKLVISSKPVEGNMSGEFAGDKKFDGSQDIPWEGTRFAHLPENYSYDVTSVVVEGTVAPMYTNLWFAMVGYNSEKIDFDLQGLYTCHIKDMSAMFSYSAINATKWSMSDLCSWDTSNVTDMHSLFDNTGTKSEEWFIGDISNWDTSKVTNMSNMFNGAGDYATEWSIGDIGKWDVSSVTNMYHMFANAGYRSSTFDLDLSNWDTSKVTDMSWMFCSAGHSAAEWSIGDIGNWDTSKVTNMEAMFTYAGYNTTNFFLDLSGWDTSNVTDMGALFRETGYNSTTWEIVGLNNWDISSSTDFNVMFKDAGRNAKTFNLDLSGWDTSHVTSFDRTFLYTGANAKSFNLNLSNWNTSNVENMDYMLYNTGANATTFNLIIPKTNGNGIDNTTTTMYGKTNSIYSEAPTGKEFTLAS